MSRFPAKPFLVVLLLAAFALSVTGQGVACADDGPVACQPEGECVCHCHPPCVCLWAALVQPEGVLQVDPVPDTSQFAEALLPAEIFRPPIA